MSNPTCSYLGCTTPARSMKAGAICNTHNQARYNARKKGEAWPTRDGGIYAPEYCKDWAFDKPQAPAPIIREETTPAPAPAPAPAPVEKTKAEILEELLSGGKDERVDDLLDRVTLVENSISAHYRISLDKGGGDVVKVEGLNHRVMPYVIELLAAGVMPYIVGPAGSGKTTMAENCAAALGLDFYSTGAVVQKYELTGFQNVDGYHESQFYKAYKFGGLFLFDELDASSPAAIVAFNAALENGHWACPSGEMVMKHKDFKVIASANTFGGGSNLLYVGRNRLDGSTVDRFGFVILDYDWQFMAAVQGIAFDGQQAPYQYKCKGNSENDIAAYFRDVTLYSAAAEALGIKHIISPRACINGIKLLRRDVKRNIVEHTFIWKGLDKGSINKIKAHATAALEALEGGE